jgi:hypothetical protein
MTKPIRTTNRHAGDYARNRVPFQNSNGQLYAVRHTPMLYVVYSYGSHWPLYVYDGFDWYENEDKCSSTTSRHRTYAFPSAPTQLRSCSWLRNFITTHMGYHRQLERFQRDMGLAA